MRLNVNVKCCSDMLYSTLIYSALIYSTSIYSTICSAALYCTLLHFSAVLPAVTHLSYLLSPWPWCLCCAGVLLQSLMVARAKEDLEQEQEEKEMEKQKYLEERTPPLALSGMSSAELQVDVSR